MKAIFNLFWDYWIFYIFFNVSWWLHWFFKSNYVIEFLRVTLIPNVTLIRKLEKIPKSRLFRPHVTLIRNCRVCHPETDFEFSFVLLGLPVLPPRLPPVLQITLLCMKTMVLNWQQWISTFCETCGFLTWKFSTWKPLKHIMCYPSWKVYGLMTDISCYMHWQLVSLSSVQWNSMPFLWTSRGASFR